MKLSTKLFSSLLLMMIGFSISILSYLIITNSYLFSKKIDIKKYEEKLISLGVKCIPTNDVPVASLLIYKDSIIGEGHNDVSKNNNLTGHAEINAIKNCFEKIGLKKFTALDRNELILITTYEPCIMCRAVIEEYEIKNVIFSFPKNTMDKLKSIKKEILYFKNLRQTNNPRLQYDLFKKYPAFDSISYPY